MGFMKRSIKRSCEMKRKYHNIKLNYFHCAVVLSSGEYQTKIVWISLC